MPGSAASQSASAATASSATRPTQTSSRSLAAGRNQARQKSSETALAQTSSWLDSVLMIAITGIVYNAILAASAKNTGWQVLANALLHIVTPILTVAVWVIAGPRGWFSWRIVGAAYILPIAWLAFALVRGAVIGAYPYPFLDVVTKGYPYVLAYAGGIIVFAFVVLMALWGLDALARRATARR